ncbi:MAG: quinone-interacting membrane-bound oxidoreductase complex subunit QmoC [Candidatus Rokubacteria bacterium]|nr:quinone-interacting membrane-bound oxidoreductase complex subunit QmoC [Candidatus Rokubacteria bacterium]
MPAPVSVDLGFKREIIGRGAADLTACYQCGTCSVVCPLSTADNPFPRKEMVWVQWGLKERALGNSSIWLCHQCASCTAYCPRDAGPASLMAALREQSIRHFAAPAFMGRAASDPRFLPLLFAVPALLFLALLASLGHLGRLPEGPVVFSKLIPIMHVEIVFIAAMTLSGLGALAGGIRYWKAMRAHMAGDGRAPAQALVPTVLAILRHRKFGECRSRSAGSRRTFEEHLHPTHLAVFWGFLGLVATTTSVGIGIYVFGYLTPWPLGHPVKILGNASGVLVVGALLVFGYRRIADAERAGRSSYPDWLFIVVLGGTTLTGFLCELLRLADAPGAAYPMYVVHLSFVFVLLVYIPYSKFSHLVYRTTAMLYAASAPPAKGAP